MKRVQRAKERKRERDGGVITIYSRGGAGRKRMKPKKKQTAEKQEMKGGVRGVMWCRVTVKGDQPIRKERDRGSGRNHQTIMRQKKEIVSIAQQ